MLLAAGILIAIGILDLMLLRASNDERKDKEQEEYIRKEKSNGRKKNVRKNNN